MKTWLVRTSSGALKLSADTIFDARRAAANTFPKGTVIYSLVMID